MRRHLAPVLAAALACAGSFSATAQSPRKFTIHFGENSAAISDEARATLGVAIEMAQECATAAVSLVGYGDLSQPRPRALDVSSARANAVRNTMVEAGGINPGSITLTAPGKDRPLVDAPDTNLQEPMTRRVDISIACK